MCWSSACAWITRRSSSWRWCWLARCVAGGEGQLGSHRQGRDACRLRAGQRRLQLPQRPCFGGSSGAEMAPGGEPAPPAAAPLAPTLHPPWPQVLSECAQVMAPYQQMLLQEVAGLLAKPRGNSPAAGRCKQVRGAAGMCVLGVVHGAAGGRQPGGGSIEWVG